VRLLNPYLLICPLIAIIAIAAAWPQSRPINPCAPSITAPRNWSIITWHEFEFRIPPGYREQDLSKRNVFDSFDSREWRRGRSEIHVEEGYITPPLASDSAVQITDQCTRLLGRERALYEIAGGPNSWLMRLTIARGSDYWIAFSGIARSPEERDLLWRVIHSFQLQVR
jgi:hypothetical protein